jgi:hypothetical protein
VFLAACFYGFPLLFLLAGLGHGSYVTEWRFLTAVQLTEEFQRRNQVHCDDGICWGEAGGFRDAESCTLALLSQQAETSRKGAKTLRIEGGNKCFETPKRTIVLKS